MKRSSSSRKLGLEQFESRQMMAGNVTVAVNSGDLFITGDDAANGVQIAQVRTTLGVPVRGSYVITGLTTGGAATRINGQSSVIVRNVTDDVSVNLGRGNDLLTTTSGFIQHFFADDVTVNLGEGNNTAILNNVSVFDDLTITAGSGNDQVFVLGGIIGNQTISSDADLTINTGNGFDGVSVRNFFVRDDISIDTGFGTFADSVTLLTGNVGDDVTIRTHEGLDTVIIRTVGVNDDLLIDTASGNDRLTISDSEADELFAFLGSDNDTVSLTNVSGHRATLNGGGGIDTLATSNVAFDEFFSATSF